MSEDQSVMQEADIEAALRGVASLIQMYGSKYWPVFERLESELEAMRSRRIRLDKALAQ